jgi:hypothetical protein
MLSLCMSRTSACVTTLLEKKHLAAANMIPDDLQPGVALQMAAHSSLDWK